MRKAIILISSLFSSFNTFSQQSNLWEISGNGLTEKSYVVGTFHVMCSEDFQIKEKVKNALEKSSRFVLEVNFTDPSEVAELQKMMQSETTISSKLTREKAEKLNDILKNYGTNLKSVDHLSPQALYSLISQKAIPCPQEDVKMYDIELLKSALKQGKTFGGLETAKDQLTFLGNAYSLDDIIEQLEMGDDYSELSKDMIKVFNDENMAELDRLLKNEKFMNEEQEKWMLTVRNTNWATKSMPEMMRNGSNLFAMGAAHLMGKNGVIELLKNQGYTLTPVYN